METTRKMGDHADMIRTFFFPIYIEVPRTLRILGMLRGEKGKGGEVVGEKEERLGSCLSYIRGKACALAVPEARECAVWDFIRKSGVCQKARLKQVRTIVYRCVSSSWGYQHRFGMCHWVKSHRVESGALGCLQRMIITIIR